MLSPIPLKQLLLAMDPNHGGVSQLQFMLIALI
jgi:hypothetical protein